MPLTHQVIYTLKLSNEYHNPQTPSIEVECSNRLLLFFFTDIVPIAVGIALIALVVVVLIAYLVGRRRAAARGYVSM